MFYKSSRIVLVFSCFNIIKSKKSERYKLKNTFPLTKTLMLKMIS